MFFDSTGVLKRERAEVAIKLIAPQAPAMLLKEGRAEHTFAAVYS